MITLQMVLIALLCLMGGGFSGAMFLDALRRGDFRDGFFYGFLTVAFAFVVLDALIPNREQEEEDNG